jgi:hypothetical protein
MRIWVPITPAELPFDTHFDVAPGFSGRLIEFAYGGPLRNRRYSCLNAPFKRIADRSNGTEVCTYFGCGVLSTGTTRINPAAIGRDR